MREEIRGTWLARDRERAEENRQYVRGNADRIPADLRNKVLAVIEHAEETEKWSRVLADGWAKESEKYIAEIVFLKAEIKGLVPPIQAATSKKPLCEAADALCGKIAGPGARGRAEAIDGGIGDSQCATERSSPGFR